MSAFIAAHIGEFAALAVSLLWSISSTLFTFAGRQVGSLVVNRIRLLLALIFLVGLHAILSQPLPLDIELQRLGWLGLSGVIGLAIGDAFLFRAFVLIGPRLATLLASLAPVLAALTAWIFLGERLTNLQLVGMFLTLGGVTWVISERNNQVKGDTDRRVYTIGALCALAAAACQAIGLTTAKPALVDHYPALSATLIRMLAAAVVMWVVTAFQGQVGSTFYKLSTQKRSLVPIIVAAFIGPTLGVTLMLVAVQHSQVGVASTLTSLPPVFLLPVGHFIFKEKITWRAILGTLVTILGVALIFLAPR